jgi:hypothetical protein
MGRLASFLIGPRQKTGLRFGIPGGIGGSILDRLGSFQSFFLNRFLQSFLRSLVHAGDYTAEEIHLGSGASKRIVAE